MLRVRGIFRIIYCGIYFSNLNQQWTMFKKSFKTERVRKIQNNKLLVEALIKGLRISVLT
jgi:hypothetical protein